MQYYLKRKNEIITVIDFTDDGDVYKIENNAIDNAVSPLHNPDDFNWLKKWWKRRAVPISQGNIKEMLESKGLLGSEEYLLKNLGLSLTDYYWICPVDSDLRWEDVNLFDNDFAGNILIGELDSNADGVECHYTPNSSLQGSLEKSWVIVNGERGLLKGNRDNLSAESINEVIACKLHEMQKFSNYTKYYLRKIEGKMYDYGCYSPIFTSQHSELVSAYDIVCSEKKPNDVSNYEHFINVCAKHGLDRDSLRSFMDYLIMTDFILSGRDRHLNNIGILRDADTLRFVKAAPIYDSGKSMFVNDSIPSTQNGLLSIATTSFASDEIKMLRLVKDRSLVDVARLPGKSFLEDIYSLDSQMDEKRITLISEAYERKIELFRRFQLGEDLGMIKLAAKSYRPVNKNMAAYILDDDRDISNRRKGR